MRAKAAGQGGQENAQAIWELDQVRERIDEALVEVIAPSIALNADRHELVAGEDFSVNLSFPDKPAAPVKWNVDAASLRVPSGWMETVSEAKPGSNTYRFDVKIPAGATIPNAPGYAILPFPPPLAELTLCAKVGDYSFTIEKPVEFSEAKTTGILTYPLELVPHVTLNVEPDQVMVPV